LSIGGKSQEPFVIFTAYIDEADTHGPAPTIIMAAFLGHAYQWGRFDKKLGRLQKQYGFRIFHGTDFKSKSGEFSGWSDAKCMGLVNNLTELVRDNLTEGLIVHLEHDRFKNEYRAPPIPKKMNLDSQYGVCFRASMAHTLKIVLAKGNSPRLHVVIEDGHVNVGNAVTIFKEIDAVLRHQGINILGDITVTSKEKAPPCMIADFLAGTYSMMRAERGGVSAGVYQDIAPEPGKREAGLTFLELLPDALVNLKIDWQRNRERAVEERRARRELRKASLPSP
jgi:hypothetical protein